MRQGARGKWLAIEYALPESDWKVVIKYTYDKSEEDKESSRQHETAMKNLKPLGHFKKVGEPG